MVFAGIFLLTTIVLGAAVTGLVYGVSIHLEADDVRSSVVPRERLLPAKAVAYASPRPLGPPAAARKSRKRQVSLGAIG